MGSFWKAPRDVQDRVMELIGAYHPDLVLVSEETVVVFREKASASAPYGAARKVTPLIQALLGGEEIKFVLEVPADLWESLTSKDRDALLDYLLCGCSVEEDAESGNVTLKTLKPELPIYRENFDRFGLWFPKDEGNDDAKLTEVLKDEDILDSFDN